MKRHNYAAIDIGGTNTRFALFDDNAQIIKKESFRTEPDDYKKTLNKIIELVNQHNVDSIALCYPGPADYKKGLILSAPNLPGWNNMNIKDYLFNNSNLLNIESDNDANVMALANHHFYKKGPEDVTQFWTISTGLGAGLVINNKVFTGSHGFAQEIARAPLGSVIDENTYHLTPFAAELYASGTGLALRCKSQGKNWTTKEVFENYNKDPIATNVINEGIDSLARTIATSLAYVNPNLLVFGGSVSRYNSWFVEKAVALAKTYAIKDHFEGLEWKIEELGDDSALIGLYYLIKSEVEKA